MRPNRLQELLSLRAKYSWLAALPAPRRFFGWKRFRARRDTCSGFIVSACEPVSILPHSLGILRLGHWQVFTVYGLAVPSDGFPREDSTRGRKAATGTPWGLYVCVYFGAGNNDSKEKTNSSISKKTRQAHGRVQIHGFWLLEVKARQEAVGLVSNEQQETSDCTGPAAPVVKPNEES